MTVIHLTKRKTMIAVCGSGVGLEPDTSLARDVGRLIARNDCVLVCGGLAGMMRAAAKGAKSAGGLTVGILPGYDANQANPYIDVAIPTGLGHARNALVASSGDAIIALPGGSGTLSEIGLGLKMEKPVIGLTAWSDIEGVVYAHTAEEAVNAAISKID